jgi:hypothetical protein
MSGFFAAKSSQPPKAGAYQKRNEGKRDASSTLVIIYPALIDAGFRKLYERGDFPLSVSADAKGKKLKWKARQ